MDMNQNLFDALDPEITETLLSRRQVLRGAGMMGAGLVLASIPATFALLSTSAYGKENTPQDVNTVLNFALKLEYLEAEFYTRGVAADGLITDAGERAVFTQIKKHENAHVQFLQTALGSNAVAKPNFDFTAKGTFPDPFAPGNYAIFLALSQAFEDTGVRAYKGQASSLISSPDILTAALQIHSVEARHAAEVRRIRGLKGWITGSDPGAGIPPQAAPVYAGEDVTTQIGVPIGQGANVATEAFDEPPTMDQVLAIAGLFIA